MTGHIHETGPRWVPGNGSREGCVSGTTTCLPRSADGSSTILLGPCPRMHGHHQCAWAPREDASLGALFRTVFAANIPYGSRFCAPLHQCFTAAAQPNSPRGSGARGRVGSWKSTRRRPGPWRLASWRPLALRCGLILAQPTGKIADWHLHLNDDGRALQNVKNGS